MLHPNLETTQPGRLLGAAEGRRAGIHKVHPTGSSCLTAPAAFWDVLGFYLQLLAAGRLDRDNTTPEFLPQNPREQLICSKRQKKQPGASSVNNPGTNLRDGGSCGSGTEQLHHVRRTFLSLRQLHYSQGWIHLFPLSVKCLSVTPAQFLIATHICSSSSQLPHHPSTVTHPLTPEQL